LSAAPVETGRQAAAEMAQPPNAAPTAVQAPVASPRPVKAPATQSARPVAPAAAGAAATPTREQISQQILQAISRPIVRAGTPITYKLAALVVAVLMLLLPLVYLGLIGLVGYGVYYHAVNDTGMLTAARGRGALLVFAAYLAPIVAGVIAIVFMIKPLFARPARQQSCRSLRRESEPLLFAFVDRICETVGAPRPKRIDVDCQVNASASFRRGMLSMLGNDLVLTIGMPLVAGLNTRQFAGVLAHEFGHFSQGFGMRLTYVIRSMSFWFMRVVYERDEWDASLERGARSVDIRFGWVLYVAMACVWASRRVLWALMQVGHFFGSHLLRQMEFDADRYEVRLAGAEAFKQTVHQLHVLNFASEGAFGDLRELYREGRLVDDLPRLIMSRVANAPKELSTRIGEVINSSKTRWFETHPCDADRVRSAEREGGTGVFAVELPSTVLFGDFEAQSKAATWEFYRGIFGTKLQQSQLRPVADVESRHAIARQGEEAIERYFAGEWHTGAPLPLGGIYLQAPAKPNEALAELKQARAEMEQLLPTVKGASQAVHEAIDAGCQAQTLHNWLRAKAKINKETLTKWGGAAGVERAAKSAQDNVERAAAKLASLNGLARRRLSLALQLACVEKVAERLAAAGVDTTDVDKQFEALQALSAQMPTLASLYPRHATLGGMIEALQNGKGDQSDLIDVVRDLMRKVQPAAATVRKALAHTAYPYDHAKGPMSLAQYLMADAPIADDLGSIYNTLGQALELAPALYVRLLGQLVSVATAVENACGLASAAVETAAAPA
jgi:Zn-dependent protease with chaperone function